MMNFVKWYQANPMCFGLDVAEGQPRSCEAEIKNTRARSGRQKTINKSRGYMSLAGHTIVH